MCARVSVLLIGTDVPHGLHATDGQSSCLLLFLCRLGTSLDMQGLVHVVCLHMCLFLSVCVCVWLLWLLLTSCYYKPLCHQMPRIYSCVCWCLDVILLALRVHCVCVCLVFRSGHKYVKCVLPSKFNLLCVCICEGGVGVWANKAYRAKWMNDPCGPANSLTVEKRPHLLFLETKT